MTIADQCQLCYPQHADTLWGSGPRVSLVLRDWDNARCRALRTAVEQSKCANIQPIGQDIEVADAEDECVRELLCKLNLAHGLPKQIPIMALLIDDNWRGGTCSVAFEVPPAVHEPETLQLLTRRGGLACTHGRQIVDTFIAIAVWAHQSNGTPNASIEVEGDRVHDQLRDGLWMYQAVSEQIGLEATDLDTVSLVSWSAAGEYSKRLSS